MSNLDLALGVVWKVAGYMLMGVSLTIVLVAVWITALSLYDRRVNKPLPLHVPNMVGSPLPATFNVVRPRNRPYDWSRDE